ncbi:MAG: hypothetical protein RLW62_22770 [Gammaproteobacteria bacterium]
MDDTRDPADALPPAAAPAWRAYRAMLASKDAHFAALTAAREAQRAGRPPGLARAAHRDQLLATHDAAVKTFARAMQALAADDAAAHRELLTVIARLNVDLGGPQAR